MKSWSAKEASGVPRCTRLATSFAMTLLLALAARTGRSTHALAPAISRGSSTHRRAAAFISSVPRSSFLTQDASASSRRRSRPWEAGHRTSSRYAVSRSVLSHTFSSQTRLQQSSLDDDLTDTATISTTVSTQQDILPDWRSDPSLTDTYLLPTLSVPAQYVHSILKGSVSRYLVSEMEELEGVYPRVKLVRDFPKDSSEGDTTCNEGRKRKLVLLDPNQVLTSSSSDDESSTIDSVDTTELPQDQQDTYKALQQSFPGIPTKILQELATLGIQPGPSSFVLSIPYTQQTPHRILQKLLPLSAQPPPTSYEQVGHVLHLNLKSHHKPYGHLIGDVMLERLKPSIRTVVTKVGEVKGPYRTYDMQILAGINSTEVTLVEHGKALSFDLAKVYWSTRLSGQRTKSIEEEFEPGQFIADAFCGVGALCVRAAVEKNCTFLGNDLNPDAVKYCRDNALRNGVEDRVQVECGDAREFIAGLGKATATFAHLPHHLMLNFPLASTEFLDVLQSWPCNEPLDVIPTVHVYTFARGDAAADDEDSCTMGESAPRRDAADVAIDLVANGLLPENNGSVSNKSGRQTLNDLGCDVRVREVRDVAPGKVVMWVSFKATRELLLKMQR